MKRFLKWAAVAIGAVVVVVIGLYALSRALGPSDQHERALALMSDREPVTGTNAFAALWLMPYDVPPDQVAAIAANDVQRFNALSAPNGQPVGDAAAMANFVSVAQGQFARRPDDGTDLPMQCLADPVACLQHVSAREADYQRWRTHNQALIERAALDGTDYYRNPFEHAIFPPSPNFGVGARARRASQALDFVTGDREAAFSGVCHDINTWRRLGTNADTLLVKAVASGFVDGSLRMFAEMLARAPAGESLPPVCEAALVPPRPHELSMCEAMKGEFALARALMVAGMADSNLLYDRDATSMRSAAIMAVGCDDATERDCRRSPVTAVGNAGSIRLQLHRQSHWVSIDEHGGTGLSGLPEERAGHRREDAPGFDGVLVASPFRRPPVVGRAAGGTTGGAA